MCDMCDENEGDFESCQDCGKLICFDVEVGDDVLRPAYVTSSGDLFCDSSRSRGPLNGRPGSTVAGTREPTRSSA